MDQNQPTPQMSQDPAALQSEPTSEQLITPQEQTPDPSRLLRQSRQNRTCQCQHLRPL